MKFTKYIILIFIIPIYTQFGKNIVQYKSFDWFYLQTQYFDIYYYDTDINAQYVAEESEQAYNTISNAIGWDLNNRVPIIIYNSHNDFQQTNIIDMYMPEGVGGVTELYKNRVVIPYDGSQKQFRDVLHHELVHAFINDYIYKGNVMNMQNQSIAPIPLWMNEGLAEFLSINWSSESEMWIRDLVINGEQLPKLNQLNGWLAYRGGQSIWKFLVEKIDQKYLEGESQSPTIIASIFKSISSDSNLDAALESSIGLNLKELEEEWHQYLKEEYWPDINNRSHIKDIARPLVDHKKLNNTYNIAPSISPDGTQIAFYSNKDEVMGIYIISSDCNECNPKSINKILKGEMSTKFEELHILKPGISWSSDSKKILLAAKSYGEDALFIIDIESNEKMRYTFPNYDIKAIFQPAWHPFDNNLIAFIGSNNNQSDIYLYDLENKILENLTNDIFTDKEVKWSNNGESLLFSSDRYYENQYDLHSLSLESKKLERLTNTLFNEHYPVPIYADSLITYICDENGINNIYLMNYKANDIFQKPITNLFTGVKQLTAYNDELIFTGLVNQQFGIYKLDSSLINQEKNSTNSLTKWKINFQEHNYTLGDNKIFDPPSNYRNYIFNQSKKYDNDSLNALSDSTDSIDVIQDSLGNYIAHKYKTRFTLDIGQMSYGFGLNSYDYNQPNGMAQFIFSDILGDHKIYLSTETNIDFKRSDYSFGYRYLPKKIDWTFILFHNGMPSLYSYYDDLNEDGFQNNNERIYYFLDQQFMLSLNASLPFSKFQRVDFGFGSNYWSRHKEFIDTEYNEISNEFVEDEFRTVLDIKYVWDNTRWGYTYPNNGSRFYFKYQFSPYVNNNNNQNTAGSFTFDGRAYKSLSNGVSIFIRNFSGASLPKNNNHKFYLGSNNSLWSGPEGEYNPLEYYEDANTNQLYFSEYVAPIRGASFLNKNGHNVSLFNIELRAPFLIYYFPAIKWLGQINAIAFIDIGGAWNETEWNITQSKNWKQRIGSDNQQGWIMSYGWGPRLIFLGLPMQLHYSWSYNPFTKKRGAKHWEITIGFDM